MLNDEHLKVLLYDPDSSKIFPGQDIKGGVAITYHDENVKFGAIKQFIYFDELRAILQKVESVKEKSFSEIIYASESYRFTEKLHQDIPKAEKLLSKGHKYDLKTSVLKTLDGIAFMTEALESTESVSVIGLVDGRRSEKWIKKDYIIGPDNFTTYKVFVPKANGSGALGEVLSTPLIGQPLIGHTQSFISIGKFANEADAQACLKYVKSKFARAMLGILKITQDNPASKWKYVPLQDFTSDSDIDWYKSVADIDRQLYAKYGLTQDEIDFIETHVKEME